MKDLEQKNIEEKIARKMEQLKEKQNRKKERKDKPTGQKQANPQIQKIEPIEVGCQVKIKGQSSVGDVLEINEKNIVVAFGMIKTTVKPDRLERVSGQPKKTTEVKSSFVSTRTQDNVYEKKLNFKQDIDIRGMRGEEATQAVTYFIDDAILLGISRVRILHGTGTGILRTLIRNYLSTVPGVAHFQDEHVQFGGAGITVVDLG